jgi:DNA-binding transcriptional ArsR family regulator
MLLTVHFRGGSMTAGEIAGRFKHAWPTTTRHLQVLVDAGLLQAHREGRQRVYQLNRDKLEVILDWIGWFKKPAVSR